MGVLVTLVTLFAIARITLTPGAEPMSQQLPIMCVACGTYGGIDFVLNILMFIPLGLGLSLLLNHRVGTIAICAIISFTIELLQFQFVANRDSSLSDLLANSIGGVVGVGLGMGWRYLLIPTPGQATKLGRGISLLWVLVIFLSAWSLKPQATDSPLWIQLTANLGGFDRFAGDLHAASINNGQLVGGRIPDTSNLPAVFKSDTLVVSANVSFKDALGLGQRRQAPIVSVFDGNQREIMMFAQADRHLTFRYRSHLSTLRLREPIFTLTDAFVLSDSSATLLSAARKDGKVLLTASHNDEKAETVYRTHPFLLWSAFLPFNLLLKPLLYVAFSAGWAFLLALIPGFWHGARHNLRLAAMESGAVVLGTLLLVPVIVKTPAIPLWGWVFTFAGLVVGFLIGSLSFD